MFSTFSLQQIAPMTLPDVTGAATMFGSCVPVRDDEPMEERNNVRSVHDCGVGVNPAPVKSFSIGEIAEHLKGTYFKPIVLNASAQQEEQAFEVARGRQQGKQTRRPENDRGSVAANLGADVWGRARRNSCFRHLEAAGASRQTCAARRQVRRSPGRFDPVRNSPRHQGHSSRKSVSVHQSEAA